MIRFERDDLGRTIARVEGYEGPCDTMALSLASKKRRARLKEEYNRVIAGSWMTLRHVFVKRLAKSGQMEGVFHEKVIQRALRGTIPYGYEIDHKHPRSLGGENKHANCSLVRKETHRLKHKYMWDPICAKLREKEAKGEEGIIIFHCPQFPIILKDEELFMSPREIAEEKITREKMPSLQTPKRKCIAVKNDPAHVLSFLLDEKCVGIKHAVSYKTPEEVHTIEMNKAQLDKMGTQFMRRLFQDAHVRKDFSNNVARRAIKYGQCPQRYVVAPIVPYDCGGLRSMENLMLIDERALKAYDLFIWEKIRHFLKENAQTPSSYQAQVILPDMPKVLHFKDLKRFLKPKEIQDFLAFHQKSGGKIIIEEARFGVYETLEAYFISARYRSSTHPHQEREELTVERKRNPRGMGNNYPTMKPLGVPKSRASTY
ncbi:MAG: HNH endonuclease [Lactobacillales bacterium]|jgi:hypothetical protein|nr:HNH endonuclease [Lactobacillales bacterium]